MSLFLLGLSVLSFSAFLMAFTGRSPKMSGGIFLTSLTVGCLSGLAAALQVLMSHAPVDYRLSLRLPFGEFYLGIDFLSAFFLVTITVVFLLAGIYGYAYLKDSQKKNLSVHYALYHIALIALMLVAAAKNAVLFLIGWEMMTLTSYFLIVFYDERPEVRKAGYLYLIATHTGTFCLWIMFLLMGGQAGSMNFDQMMPASFPLPLAGLLFILGVLGFGVKAGFIPFHIWLPHAHPAAPSHISAVLSGVLIKMGIYGLLRIIFIIKDFPPWCPVVLLLIGITSGVGGVLYALGQHEIKKLLAYHSIENIGIITLGLGVGLWGQLDHNEVMAVVGYAGALLHVFNHAIFKGLLFLSAGSVIRSTHTGEIDHLGGLLKIFPWTGHLFLIGALSICGLPLFNGFVSEWLVYRALFEGIFRPEISVLIVCGLSIIALALIGSLAAACFTKAFGAVFLGNNRSPHDAHWQESALLMCVPMACLAGICLWVGLFPNVMVSLALDAAPVLISARAALLLKATIIFPLLTVVLVFLVLAVIMTVFVLLKRISMKALAVETAPTWGCGYSSPTSRMQYTAASFAEPILRIFRNILGYGIQGSKPKGYFPKPEAISSFVRESAEDIIFRPAFELIKSISAKLKIIQCGYTQLYLFYIFAFLLVLLIWKMI